MGIIFIRHGAEPGTAVWQIDWRPEGKHGVRRRKNFEGTRAEAEELEKSIKSTLGLDLANKTARVTLMTIEAAMPEFLRWHQLNRAARTHEDVRRSMPGILKVFGRLAPPQITPAHVTEFVALRPNKRRANQKDLHYLMGMVRWMVESGYSTPMTFKPRAPKYRRPVPTVPSPATVLSVLAQVHDPSKQAMIRLMWEAGLRISSVSALRWEHVDWHPGSIRVTVKGEKDQVVPMPGSFRDLMFERRKTSGWVFLNERTGQPVKSIKKLLTLASRRAGLATPLTHHAFRHAYATDTLQATGDLRLVQTALNHTNIATTTIYTHVQVGRIAEAQNKVAAMREAQATSTGTLQHIQQQVEINKKQQRKA